jgi:capsular exopolysaccharide synthesis family protein
MAVAVATTAAVYASLRQQSLYRASSDVFLSTQDLVAALSNVQLPYVDPVRAAETQSDLAQTPAVAQRALKIAGVKDRTPADLLGRSSVATTSNADVLSFSVTDPNPKLASRLATAYAKAYTSYRLEIDTRSLVRARSELQQRLTELQAEGRQGSAVYANLSEKDQQLRTMELLQGSNTLVIRAAQGAAQIQPQPTRNGVLGGVLGFVLGIGIAFLLDALNTRVRTATEVQERLDLPMLGRIPEPPRRFRGKGLVMLADPHTPEAESFRILATNLEFVNLDRGARTIMVTSAFRGEGKSTTAANLAVALARAGHSVALVDLDLRKPSIPPLFELDGSVGLAQVALGRATLHEALMKVPILDTVTRNVSTNGTVGGLLQVLQTGPPPPNPAEFVDSRALSEILAELEGETDIVLLDTPPLLGLSDSVKLSKKVDGMVVVVRLSMIKRPALTELHRVLEAAPTAKLGVILTGGAGDEAYGYAYGYGYGSRRRGSARPEHELVG